MSLEAARETRRKRAEIARGSLMHLTLALSVCPEWARTWRVSSALAHVPGVGAAKVSLLCKRLGISPGDTLGSLSDEILLEIAQFVSRIDEGCRPIDAALGTSYTNRREVKE